MSAAQMSGNFRGFERNTGRIVMPFLWVVMLVISTLTITPMLQFKIGFKSEYTQDTEFYEDAMEKLVLQWDKCLNMGGDCGEVVQDGFPRFVSAFALKDKSKEELANAMERIFREIPGYKKLHVDHGREFYNRTMDALLNKYRIERYTAEDRYLQRELI
ncbi:unnamed protein product [Darwinula stevensoni]|uniref:Integrase catalytic domain-containing protein n=1 Tax=Darwinula stevensoni TaxID=69355 RepID=A0A7R8XBG3_9CRUS|nr:unnamed protein product [Darwinula stevensoni]CAG0892820.1 unnamed protein product [Darwinula stevensoni]